MQTNFVIQQVKEEAKKIEQHLMQLQQDEQLTHHEAEQFLTDIEKLYRRLAVYVHTLKQQEIGGDLKVHLKIMQHTPAIEPVTTEPEKTVEPTQQPVVQEVKEEPVTSKTGEPVSSLPETQLHLKKIEFNINDKFRIINELFLQSQPEFQAAMQQINSIGNLEESIFYLDSLKPIYNWKDDHALVKNLYSLVHKRFM